MTAQLVPILMGIVALVATILKFRTQLNPRENGTQLRDGQFKVDSGLVTVSGVTVSQLQAIANALSKQETPKNATAGK